MDDKQPSIAERNKTELTERGIEYRALPSIQRAANDPNHLGKNGAIVILGEWNAAKNLTEPSRTKKQIEVRKRMMKFVREYPI